MTEQQLQDLGPALADFFDEFLFCCDYTQTFGHLGTYVRGLLSDLPRKTAEPIALRAGTPVRTLQEFLRDHAWDAAAVRDQLQRRAAVRLPALPGDDLGSVGLFDETSARKQGHKTPGVSRQYLGDPGKVDNGIVTVHLGVCRGTHKSLLDFDLFLPENWSEDRRRCREADIPDTVVHRPKWQIALEQLDRARANGIAFDWLTFDAEYGKCPAFLAGLNERRLAFVGEVPRTCACLAVPRDGRSPDRSTRPHPAEDVVGNASVFRGQAWQVLRLARQTQEEQVWRVKAAPVWLSGASGWSSQPYRLIWASCDATGDEKFVLSNASADVPVERLVRVAFRRATVEHAFRLCKSELGFSHFEGRSYTGLMRHLSLCLLALTFVAEQTDRLRGEKPGPDGRAGVSGAGRGLPRLAGEPAANGRKGPRVGSHRIPPKAQPRREPIAAAAASGSPYPQETQTA